MYKIKKIEKQNLLTLRVDGIWLGAPKNICSLCQGLPALMSFDPLKKTFSNNKLWDGIGSPAVLNKDLHMCK